MSNLSILVCCYGDYPDISNRCLNSIISQNRKDIPLLVGGSSCGPTTRAYLFNYYIQGKIDTLLFSQNNINKDPIMRVLIDLSKSKYILWLDDDSYLLPEALDVIEDLCNEDFDVSGKEYFIGRSPEYIEKLKKKSWFNPSMEMSNVAHFPTGGIWIGRTEYLLKNNYPDRDMIKAQDDVLLGDMVLHTSGDFKRFPKEVEDRIIISGSERRGLDI